jgi:hypothetical protein
MKLKERRTTAKRCNLWSIVERNQSSSSRPGQAYIWGLSPAHAALVSLVTGVGEAGAKHERFVVFAKGASGATTFEQQLLATNLAEF